MLLSTVIPTLNEIENIGPCLESARQLPGERLVVDESTDGTDRLAEKLGARVLKGKFDGISAVRNAALENVSGDYVFFLDADERITPALAREMINFLKERESRGKAAGAMRRHNFAFGARARFGPLFPDRVVRLFPRGEVEWTGKVHERALFDLPVVDFKGPLLHHTYKDFASYIAKQERFMRLWAEEARARGKKADVFKAVGHSFFSFLKMFFLKLGILGGPVSWALCLYNSGAYTLGKYLLLADEAKGGGSKDPAENGGPPESEADGSASEGGKDPISEGGSNK
ncbi:MAG: glycosyltransferase family 2 protein [Deltaproteobacteria bacterium]|jgi:glycosyltransferase involved in cell wall biosynthesis|nr:glycosyltransferase family 2 protein [Deltaproteobacteria bacterium]